MDYRLWLNLYAAARKAGYDDDTAARWAFAAMTEGYTVEK